MFCSKSRGLALHGTDLELILHSRGIDRIIVIGIATNVCCERTAHEATVRDFHVFFRNVAPRASILEICRPPCCKKSHAPLSDRGY